MKKPFLSLLAVAALGFATIFGGLGGLGLFGGANIAAAQTSRASYADVEPIISRIVETSRNIVSSISASVRRDRIMAEEISENVTDLSNRIRIIAAIPPSAMTEKQRIEMINALGDAGLALRSAAGTLEVIEMRREENRLLLGKIILVLRGVNSILASVR